MGDRQQNASGNLIGYSAAIVQAIFYAMMGIFGKLLYATGLDSRQVMMLRMVFTVMYLGVILLIWRKHRLFSRNPRTYLQSILFFLSGWLYLLAVEYMNAGVVTCIFYTFPAVVALINAVFFHEKLTWKIIFALVLSMLGIVLVSGILEPQALYVNPVGVVAAVISCLAFAVYSVVVSKTSTKESSFTSTFSMSSVCMVACLVIFAPQVPGAIEGFSIYRFTVLTLFAFLSTILPIVLYIVAIKYIGSTKASILSLIETPSSLILAWLILGETLSVVQFIGAVFIMISVVAVTLKGKEQKE